jgi:histidinol dehydrogenase
MNMRPTIVKWTPGRENATVERFLRRPAFDPAAEAAARRVLADVRREGDRAVARYAARFDGARLRPAQFRVTVEDLRAASAAVDAAFRRAVREANRRVAAFSRAGMRRDWSLATPGGGRMGERFAALDRVGVYIPGGEAPLASTVVMTVTLAKAAGVREIVACTPSRRGADVNPHILHALAACGATEIYRVGGMQAIGMMAYGTETVRRVDKIVGPGGAFVTAAKRQVYGDVALDLVAGPSEIAILADASADPRFVAADLLSQAEHGTGHEKALLATDSAALARAVAAEVARQAARLSRCDALARVIRSGMLLAVTRDVAAALDLCNAFAPEHLELMVRQPDRWVTKARHAGATFVGPWTPESAGDFVAGPSHVLPTGGAARMFSGLTVDDFRRRTSVIAFTRRDLRAALPTIEAFGRVEGLDGHAASARIRFGEDGQR